MESVNRVDPSKHGIQHVTDTAPVDLKTADHVPEKAPVVTMDPAARKAFERKILWKMDIRLIPVLTLLYLLSFLDRTNIGNAAVLGLQDDINLTPDQFNWCLTAFFFTYCAFEVPSNLLLKKLRPSRWLPSIMIAWGLVMTFMGLVQNFAGLLTARLFLGAAEAGLPPGVVYYLTMWYSREEMQLRQALFFAGASIAGAFSGLLAFAIGKMDGVAGLEGWRWLFILEGILTIVVAIAAFWLIYDFPETASFLTEEEREFVIHRLKYQGQDIGAADASNPEAQETQPAAAQAEGFKWQYVRDAFKDWQIYAFVIVYWGIICPLYGIGLFLPTILRDLGHTANAAQLMTIPVYITAAIVAVIVAYFSDRVGLRSPFIIVLYFLMLTGFIMAISSANSNVVYAGVFIAASGIYAALPGLMAWIGANLAGSYKRAAGMALYISLGATSGIFASNFYRKRDSPRYYLGHALELGFITVGLIAATSIVVAYRFINQDRRRRVAAGEHREYTSEQLSDLGDKAVTFRYAY